VFLRYRNDLINTFTSSARFCCLGKHQHFQRRYMQVAHTRTRKSGKGDEMSTARLENAYLPSLRRFNSSPEGTPEAGRPSSRGKKTIKRNSIDGFPAPWLVMLVLLGSVLLLAGRAFGGVTASISGTVKDTTGFAIAGAAVSATNVETGIEHTLHSNAQRYHSFQELPLGHYNIEVQQTGFKSFARRG